MLLLMLFAIVAGAGTAITPCVLPVLPALLSASSLGGRRRPLGIVLGLAVTFTIAIVALAQLVKGVGLASGATRTLAILVLIAFGIVLLIPGLAARVQAPLSRLARFGPKSRGDGFWSGIAVGGALGFVCAPCAGPILAAVTSVSASSGASLRVVVVALSYTAGLSAILLLYALGGRAVIERVRRRARGDLVERTLGAVLLATGVAMVANLDVRFEEALAKDASLPAVLVNPTRSLEKSCAVQSRLSKIRPGSRFGGPCQKGKQPPATAAAHGSPLPAVGIPGVQTPSLSDLGPAPGFTATQRWWNTPRGAALSLGALRGHVVLVDFWTYTCINCIRTLPFLKGLYATYHPYGLEIVGVETPEFAFEQQASNVAQAIASDGIRYPVVQDNRYGTWNAYQNQYWPAEYLIDGRGEVRHTHFGEGDYEQSEAAVRTLLAEAGGRSLPPPMSATAQLPASSVGTPETYLDSTRASGFLTPPRAGVHGYNAPAPTKLQLNEFALQGQWRVGSESATPAAAGASVAGAFKAAHVYLVMTSAGRAVRNVRVLLDGHPIPKGASGADVHGGAVPVSGQRLYSLVSLPEAQQHAVTVEVPPGVSAYDFTFG